MRKRFFLLLIISTIFGIFPSCNGTLRTFSLDNVKVSPQPLELVDQKVPVTIHTTIPPKWFNKKASVTITPVLRYQEGEAMGTPFVYQGEKIKGNAEVIPYKIGKNVVLTSSFNYVPEMHRSQLYLSFQAKINKKPINIPSIRIGDGVLATIALLDPKNESLAIIPDKFQRSLKEIHEATILFLIQQANLQVSELNKGELTGWKNLIKESGKSSEKKVILEISSYASPEGGFELNEKLAKKRQGNTKNFLLQELQKSKINLPIDVNYTAQDWEGFKKLVIQSTIQDKDLILNILDSYSDPEEREREIKNISGVYSTLTDYILPQLRRSKLIATIELIGKSNEELLSIAQSNPEALNVEELLFAATLTSILQEKETIYQKVTEQFPQDPRGFNNLGTVVFAKGDVSNAEKLFNQASQLSGPNSPKISLNLGWIALIHNDTEKAISYFKQAVGTIGLSNALAYLAMLKGDYVQAIQKYGQESCNNNVAIGQILLKNYEDAQNTLHRIKNPNAVTYYLKAILAARTNLPNEVVLNLKQSFELDSAWVSYASKDIEFASYATNEEFLKLVGK